VLSLGSLTAGVLGEESHFAGGLPIFVMAGISAIASVWLREAHARATARGGLVALIAGMAVTLAALHFGSTVLFLPGAATAGLGFGPAFARTRERRSSPRSSWSRISRSASRPWPPASP
jgi:hypothetical protein